MLSGFTFLFGRLSVAKEVLSQKYLDSFSYFSSSEGGHDSLFTKIEKKFTGRMVKDSQNCEPAPSMRKLESLGKLKEVFKEEMKKKHEGEWLEDFVEVQQRAKEPLLAAIDDNQLFGSKDLAVSWSEEDFFQDLALKYLPTLLRLEELTAKEQGNWSQGKELFVKKWVLYFSSKS